MFKLFGEENETNDSSYGDVIKSLEKQIADLKKVIVEKDQKLSKPVDPKEEFFNMLKSVIESNGGVYIATSLYIKGDCNSKLSPISIGLYIGRNDLTKYGIIKERQTVSVSGKAGYWILSEVGKAVSVSDYRKFANKLVRNLYEYKLNEKLKS